MGQAVAGEAGSSPCNCSRGVARLLQGRQDRTRLTDKSCVLRIIQITDVYVLENFPHLRNLIKEKRAELQARGGSDLTISMLTGDFLAPYLLSAFDKGAGMMQMINKTPIDYLTWGNHEDDVGDAGVFKREREYEGCWINTNMQSHETFAESRCQVDAKVLEVQSPDGSNKRRIGLLGIISSSPSLYRPGAFAGATIEDPWETMRIYKEKMEKERGCDLVIPLCHLYEPQDEHTAREFDFPVLLSGHDHHIVDRTVEGTRILKPGLDGIYAWQVDVIFPSPDSEGEIVKPVVDAHLLKVKDWPADEELLEVARKALSVLDPLRKTQLAFIPDKYRPLSSFNSRGCHTSMGTYLLSRTRDALNMYTPLGGEPRCDVALLKAGNVRGGKNYEADEHLTLEVLQSEFDGTKEVVIVPVPGLILKTGLRETWEKPNPGWMQYDDGVILDEDNLVTHIGGEPLDLARIYKVASISDFWRKRDAPTIGAYFELHPQLLPEPDSGVGFHVLLIRLFAMQIWQRIWRSLDIDFDKGYIDPESFKRLDYDNDGKLSREDIKKAISSIAGLETFAGTDTVVQYMFEELTAFQRTRDDPAQDGIDCGTLQEAAKHWSLTSLSDMESFSEDSSSSSEDEQAGKERGGDKDATARQERRQAREKKQSERQRKIQERERKREERRKNKEALSSAS